MNRRDTEKRIDKGTRGANLPSVKVLKDRFATNPLSLTAEELCRLLEVRRAALNMQRRASAKMKWSKKN